MFEVFKNLFHEAVDYKGLIQKGAQIIDVRGPSEFASGNIKGSKNIPLDQFEIRLDELKKSGKPVITVCRSGSRSGAAKSMLDQAGIEAYNGGAWDSLDRKLHQS